MRLSLSAKCSERIVLQLSDAVGYPGGVIDIGAMRTAREQAFSGRTPDEFAFDYLRSEIFSKWELNSDVDLDAVAFRAFRETERSMATVNRWLRSPKMTWVLDYQRLRKARAIIRQILGVFDLNELVESCNWSSGATTEFKRSVSQVQNKWVLSTHLTAGTLPYYEAFHNWAPWPETRREPTLVSGNRVTTVPKSYKTNRVIAIEPSWSMFFQKGIGAMIRRRLRRFGQLHPDAQSRARKLAQLGSSSGLLATLDLSSASDSVSLALCELLLPADWYTHIVNVRCQVGMVEQEVFPYEKVSSMGNGYTFELETLLFYALACTHAGLGNKFTHVYGDDIIVPSDLAMPLAETLAEVGFDLNIDKSFWSGGFRESCGGHYFNGVDVKPFYVKRYPSHVGDVINLHNRLVEWLQNQRWSEADQFTDVLRYMRRQVPREFWGPVGEEGTLWSHWDAARPEWSSRYQCFRTSRLVKVPRFAKGSHDKWELGSYLQTLWKGSSATQHDESPSISGAFKFVKARCLVDRNRWIDPTVQSLR